MKIEECYETYCHKYVVIDYNNINSEILSKFLRDVKNNFNRMFKDNSINLLEVEVEGEMVKVLQNNVLVKIENEQDSEIYIFEDIEELQLNFEIK